MLTKLPNILFAILAILLFTYVLQPELQFPQQIPGSMQSMEEADTEYEYRRAYFTNLTRQEVVSYYQSQFRLSIFGFEVPSLGLNYPPEDAQTLIRDQTRSSFLEELVYPLRESFYINGFKPTLDKDEIWYKGVHYEQKITVRFVPGNRLLSLFIVIGALVSMWIVFKFLVLTIRDISTLLLKFRK